VILFDGFDFDRSSILASKKSVKLPSGKSVVVLGECGSTDVSSNIIIES